MQFESYLRSLLFEDPPEDFYRPWRLPAPFFTLSAPAWAHIATGLALAVALGGAATLWLFSI